MNASRALRAGDVIRRLKVGTNSRPDDRVFKINSINFKTGVFSADSADGQWSSWGGPISQLVDGDTFEMVSE